MIYWFREIAGWLLVLLGLAIFGLTILLLLNARIIEAGPLVFMGVIVFRGGIHLLKVAVAARVWMDAKRSSEAVSIPPTRPVRV